MLCRMGISHLLAVLLLVSHVSADIYPNGYDVVTCDPPPNNGGKFVIIAVNFKEKHL